MKITTLILLVVITTFAFIGCEKDDSTNYSRVEKIRELAQKSKNDFDTEIVKISDNIPSTKSVHINIDTVKINSAIDFTKSHSVKSFFLKENINPLIINMAEFYRDNLNNQNIYELINVRFNTLSDEEMIMAFNITNYSFFLEQLCMIQTRKSISGSCALAVAGAASAVAIGNVAGLIWWGASYSLTLAGVVTSC